MARFLHVPFLACHSCLLRSPAAVSPGMDDTDAINALLGVPTLAVSDLAAVGATVSEISGKLGLSTQAVAAQLGDITPAQLRRIAHVLVDRAIGTDGLAPHVQAAQFLLSNRVPEVYGRQAQSGSATLRIVVDRDYTKRAGLVTEGELVQPALPPPTG